MSDRCNNDGFSFSVYIIPRLGLIRVPSTALGPSLYVGQHTPMMHMGISVFCTAENYFLEFFDPINARSSSSCTTSLACLSNAIIRINVLFLLLYNLQYGSKTVTVSFLGKKCGLRESDCDQNVEIIA